MEKEDGLANSEMEFTSHNERGGVAVAQWLSGSEGTRKKNSNTYCVCSWILRALRWMKSCPQIPQTNGLQNKQ